jgi:hypothetical protein
MSNTIDPAKPYVELTIKDGEQRVEAHNYRGNGCVAAVTDVQRILGGAVVSSVDKPEINLKPQQQAAVSTVNC